MSDHERVPLIRRGEGLAIVYRAALSALRGEQLDAAIEAVPPAGERRRPGSPHGARAADTLGLAQGLKGDLAAAERAYARTAALAQRAGVRYLAINARCEEALMQIGQGRLAQAAQTCRLALAAGEEPSRPPGWPGPSSARSHASAMSWIPPPTTC